MEAKRRIHRREFLEGVTRTVGSLSVGGVLAGAPRITAQTAAAPAKKRDYAGPNVIIVRFGGGVRRRETIVEKHTYCPYLVHELFPRGTVFPLMEIDAGQGVETGHGQGTLHILTGKYNAFKDVNTRFLGERFEPEVPTLFEYFRKAYNVPESQTLIINGEDRIDEEFYSFSNHHLFGVEHRSNVLSLYRFKVYLLRQQIREGKWSGDELEKKRKELEEMVTLDLRASEPGAQSPELARFWKGWRRYYGETGLVNPRGDRVLTEIALRAMQELQPRLMMVNYNDCDYVHWGFMSHYTRGIQIMDEGIRQIVAAVESNERYRDNTIIAVVPDCGRDSNRFVAVPCQHHFGSRSAHEIFAFLFGPGVEKNTRVDKKVDQIQVAATLGALLGVETEFTAGPVLEEAVS